MNDGSTAQVEREHGRFSADQVLDVELPLTPVGRRGVQPEAVERFRGWVAEALSRTATDSSALRAEIERLHLYIRSQWSQGAPGPAHPSAMAGRPGQAGQAKPPGQTPAAGVQAHGAAQTPAPTGAQTAQGLPSQAGTPIGQALEVLARAQAIADQRIAAADARMVEAQLQIEQAQRLVENAEKRAAMAREQARHSVLEADEVIEDRWMRAEREIAGRLDEAEHEALAVVARACREYEEILTRAHRRAEHAAERALEDCREEAVDEVTGQVVPADLQMKAAYLQTFARVSGAALRATLDVTRQEFQRLWPQSADTPPAPLPAYRIDGTGELQAVLSTPAVGLGLVPPSRHLEGPALLRPGAVLSGVIRPAVSAR